MMGRGWRARFGCVLRLFRCSAESSLVASHRFDELARAAGVRNQAKEFPCMQNFMRSLRL
jgi:hypothetical protein